MQVDVVACGKTVEKLCISADFSGKVGLKNVEKYVNFGWNNLVQNTQIVEKIQFLKRLNVEKMSFARVLQNKLNNFIHKIKWRFFSLSKGVLHIFHIAY